MRVLKERTRVIDTIEALDLLNRRVIPNNESIECYTDAGVYDALEVELDTRVNVSKGLFI